jgi:ubiquinone/menaquinone biosynthesis C-methylase UbiE
MSYVLGGASAEHERLVRQAPIFNPLTERLFLDAGIGSGERVLDIGSGVGDVAMLAARLVGPSGAVTCIERDAGTVAVARGRAKRAGLDNVSFIQGDVANVPSAGLFDVVVGRFILEYVPDPGGVVRSLAALLRPGGVMAFQSVWPLSLIQLTPHLPLRAKCAALMYRTFERAGVHLDIELVLYRIFPAAGLPSPNMRIEVAVGDEPNIVRWLHDLFVTLVPRIPKAELNEIGDLDTLAARLEAERIAAKSFASCVGVVSAWARKPG